MRIRQGASKTAAVLGQAGRGEFVEGLGEISPNRDTATLGDREYVEPYYKVRTLRPDQLEGYLFGGGLQLLYRGRRDQSPDLAQLTQYAAFLKELPMTELGSGGRIWAYLESHPEALATPALADAMFILTDGALTELEIQGEFYAMLDGIEWTNEQYEQIWRQQIDMNARPETRELALNGFALATAEGSVFPVADVLRLEAFFAPKGSQALKDWLSFQARAFREPVWDDGGIVVELGELASRTLALERFSDQYPDFGLHQRAAESEHWHAYSLLLGSDNSWPADYDTELLRDDFRAAWDQVLREAPQSRTAGYIRKVQAELQREGGKYTRQVRKVAAGLLGVEIAEYEYEGE